MLCHRTSRGVVANTSQMLTNATPETSPSFADVEMGASAAAETVHEIFRSAGEMIADGEGAFTCEKKIILNKPRSSANFKYMSPLSRGKKRILFYIWECTYFFLHQYV